MKKIYSIAIMLLCVVMSTSAAKVLINPGHGGHDSDDRPTPMPLGVEMFYESDGNLTRGKYMAEFCKEVGLSYSMTRTTNYSSDDLDLTYIATLSNNYGGYFSSLHTNGGNASANYTIAFFRGATYSPYAQVIAPSQEMGLQVAKQHQNTNITSTTYSTPRSQSDYAFWGWNYGVLRTNTRPGYLMEAWFHDYRPETLRLKSDMYNRFLAWQTVRAFYNSPGGISALKGCIIGDVRDMSKACGYTSYTTRDRDSYLAINGATVTLYNSSGAQVQQVTTDNNCNGVFAFFGVAAGTYKIEVKKSGYKTASDNVTVSNNTCSKKQFSVTAGTDDGISLNPSTTGFGETTVGNTSAKTITVTGAGLSSNITISNSDNTNFSINTTSLGASGGSLTVTYKPQTAGNHSTTIKFTSGSKTASMVVTGVAKNPPLKFTEGWNYSETTGKKAAWMADYKSYRNMAFGNGKLYIVDTTNGSIIVVNAQTGEKLWNLDMTGVSGGAIKVVDVAYVDGKIVATNIATTTNGPLKVYVWDNDAATTKPTVLLETTNIGGMDRVGDAIEIKGNLTSGTICYLGQQSREYTKADGSTATGNCNSLVTYAISNGVVSTTPTVADIDGFIIGLSPRLIPYGNDYWVAGQNYRASVVTAKGELTKTVSNTALAASQGNDIVTFSFKGDTYAFATDYDPGTSGDATTMLYNGRAVLLDGNAGWADATNAGSYPSAGMSSKTRNTTMSSSICVNVNGDKGVEMWVLVHNQGIAYYKSGTVPTYQIEDPTDPIVTPSVASLSFSTTEGYTDAKTLTVSGERLTGNITLSLSGSNANQFKLSTTSIAQSSGSASASVKVTYDPSAKGTHSAVLNISSDGALTKSVQLSGTCTANIVFNENINALEEVWNISQTSKKTANWVTYGSLVNNDIAVNGDRLYAVSRVDNSNNQIYIVDAYKGEKLGQLDVSPCTTGTHLISSVEVMGGKVIACNLAASASSVFNIYIWDNDNAVPTTLLSTTEHNGVRTGDAMSVSGNLTDGKIWFCYDSSVFYYTVKNGAVTSTTPTVIGLTKDGAAYTVSSGSAASNITVESDGSFWVSSKDYVATHFSSTGAYIETMDVNAVGNKQGADVKIFTLGNKKYAAVATYKNTSNTTLADGAFSLINVTSGYNASSAIGTYPSAGLGGTRNTSFRSSICTEVGDKDLYIWINIPAQGVACYKFSHTTEVGVEDVVVENEDVEMVLSCDGSVLAVAGVEAEMIQVYNMSGACVAAVAGSNEVDVEALNGIYVVAVKDAQGVVRTVKVAIR